jgi:hypothetical protein
MPGYRRSKFIALCLLIGHVPMKNIMSKCPDLVDTLLESIYDSSGATHVRIFFFILITMVLFS